MTKESPLLMNGPMVLATLEDRKSQTRRLPDLRPIEKLRRKGFLVCEDLSLWRFDYPVNGFPRLHVPFRHPDDKEIPWDDCGAETLESPYEVGMHLWVRETWRCFGGREYEYQQSQAAIRYRADADTDLDFGINAEWRPSIHMPRWASRITLEITDVRVERLNDISEEDAKAEGIETIEGGFYKNGEVAGVASARLSFISLWESINGTGSWEKNPWVWVIQFKRI